MIEESQDDRRRRRVLTSLLSLLLLLLLLSGWCVVRGGGEDGSLSSISTSTVQVAINGTAQPEGTPRDAGGPGSSSNRQKPLLTEVLGATSQPTPAPTATVEPTATATLAPTATVQPPATALPQATPQPAATATTQPTATPPSSPTAVPPIIDPTATPTSDGGGGAGGGTGPPILTFADLLFPGSYATGGVSVTNTGTGGFSYSVSLLTAGDAGFASALVMRIYLQSGGSCDFPGQPPVDDGLLSAPGTVLYESNFASGDKIGDPTVEIDADDLFLDPGDSEVLCMELFFPWDAGNEFQGAAVDGSFIFTAKSPE